MKVQKIDHTYPYFWWSVVTAYDPAYFYRQDKWEGFYNLHKKVE